MTTAAVSAYDAVVIGAGSNGLVAAAALGKAGRRVLVVDSAEEIGGQRRTSEFAPGFRAPPERVMTARISPPAASYADRGRTSAFYATLVGRLAALPGVTSVGLVDRLPSLKHMFIREAAGLVGQLPKLLRGEAL